MHPDHLWRFLPVGYVLTVAIELPILMAMLSRPHRWKRRLLAGFWLTACTYPVVVLVLPVLIPEPRWLYLLVAETFAPAAECALFAAAFHAGTAIGGLLRMRDYIAITVVNVASFLAGELLGVALGPLVGG